MNPSTAAPHVPPVATQARLPMVAWLAFGLLASAVGAMGTALVMRDSRPPEPSVAALPATTVPAPVASAPATPGNLPRAVTKPAPVAETRAQAPARPVPPAVVPPGSPQVTPRPAEPLATQPAVVSVCHQCGVVEAVDAVEKKGDASGLGAVAGGVVGGALGNQVGRGSGKTAMTVLGAIGGGFAGNAIEKHAKAETVYRVKVRMEDGTHRTITQATSVPVGSPVTVEGKTLTLARPQPANAEPKVVRTSGSGT